MKTALESAADWIFHDIRMDLVEGWFRQLDGHVLNAKNRVIGLAYGGIVGETTPEDVLRVIRHNLTQALFIHGVANTALVKRLSELDEENAARIKSMASMHLKHMEMSIKVISECEEMVASIICDINKTQVGD